jgi:uncharacterized protein YqfA (UPF0365 family)
MNKSTSKFDLDIDPGPINATYSPSEAMLETIHAIAQIADLPFRFWAAKTLFVNMSTLTPCSDAEEVVISVVGLAIKKGQPTDSQHQIVLDDVGQLQGVVSEDQLDEPEEFDVITFEIVNQPTVEVRKAELVRLAVCSAFTDENIEPGDTKGEPQAGVTPAPNAAQVQP